MDDHDEKNEDTRERAKFKNLKTLERGKSNLILLNFQNLQKIMDKAEHGVIYFSMGSMVLSKDLPEETRKNILEMFGTLQQTVIWKFEETWTDLPNNVHVVQWAPQHSILGISFRRLYLPCLHH